MLWGIFNKDTMIRAGARGDPMDRRLVLIRPSHRGASLARQMVGAMKRRQHLAVAYIVLSGLPQTQWHNTDIT
jgi:hypothetical protein